MQSTLLKKFFLIFTSLLLLFSFMSARAGIGVGVSINVPVPAPVEVAGPPGGYQECYIVPSGYDNGYFIHAHRVCEYVDSPYGGVWVSGFWQCGYYHHGVCAGQWAWSPSHWVQYGGPEYGVVWHNAAWYHGGPYYGPGYGPGHGHSYGHGYGPAYGHGYNHGYNHSGYNHGGAHGHGNYDR